MAATLSAILCNFNDASLLPGAVEAVLGQSHAPHEVILVDDGSTDDSVEIIRGLAAAHGLIKPIFLPRNRGPVAAGNVALKLASGSHVGWFAVDDRILPGHFARVADALVRFGDAALVTAPVIFVAPGGSERNYGFGFADSGPCRLTSGGLLAILRQRYLWLPTYPAFLRREDLLRLGGWNTDMDWLSDWFALYALALRGDTICLDQPGVRILEREASFGRRREVTHWHQAFRAVFAALSAPENQDISRCFAASPYLLTGPFGMRAATEALRHPGGRSYGVRLLLWRLLASRKLGFGYLPALADAVMPHPPA